MTKYEGLGHYLQRRDARQLRLTFAEIETILGFQLPKSAYLYPAWWSNALSHRIGIMLAGFGFKTERVDIASRELTFAIDI